MRQRDVKGQQPGRRVGGLGDEVMKITLQLKWGEGSREVARQRTLGRGVGKSRDWVGVGVGAGEKNLKGGGAQKCRFVRRVTICGRNQQAERLVTPSWQPAAPPELLPVIINIQEESRARSPRSAWQTA